MNEEEKKKNKDGFVEGVERAALEGAAAETVQRFGTAAKQHYVAYSGVDNEAGKELSRGLKSISESKVNKDFYEQNIKQQAGFSAEVKSTARDNANRVVNRNPTRKARTDDLGHVNHPLYDHVEIDVTGKIMEGSGSQMKFVGDTPDELLTKLNGKKFQKYIDADVLLSVADDDYDALMGVNGNQGIIDQKIEKLRKQVERAKQTGNTELARSKQEQIDKYTKMKRNLRKSGLTRKEAIEARLHPRLSTAKDIGRLAHRAGKEQAKYGAVISGTTSMIRNIVACSRGEITPEEAAESVVLDTGKGAAASYMTAFAGTVIKGGMQNSASSYIRSLARTNLPAGLVTTTASIAKTVSKYFRGELDGAECVEELGRDGVGEIGSAMFASIGIAVVPSTAPLMLSVIGGIAGATFGYAAATAIYQELAGALKDAKLAREERLMVEKECAEAVKMIRNYRKEMVEMVSGYLTENIRTFNNSFLEMDRAILENDSDGFIRGNVELQKLLGKEVQFTNQKEFDQFMESDVPLKL
ncbi:hypothetical protein IMSAGC018_00505 [Lachnospiraceae bacterium]|nr:hypothetical protein IMSAGC018_00505 [Lachnospiraceae bacterium]